MKNGHPDWVSGGRVRETLVTQICEHRRPGAGAQVPALVHDLNPFKLPRTAFQAYRICNTHEWHCKYPFQLTFSSPNWFWTGDSFSHFPRASRGDGNCCLIPSLWLIWFKLRGACHGLVQCLRPSPSVPAPGHFPFVSQSLLTLRVIIKTGQPAAPAREHK